MNGKNPLIEIAHLLILAEIERMKKAGSVTASETNTLPAKRQQKPIKAVADKTES